MYLVIDLKKKQKQLHISVGRHVRGHAYHVVVRGLALPQKLAHKRERNRRRHDLAARRVLELEIAQIGLEEGLNGGVVIHAEFARRQHFSLARFLFVLHNQIPVFLLELVVIYAPVQAHVKLNEVFGLFPIHGALVRVS